jgi:hypothetical protein
MITRNALRPGLTITASGILYRVVATHAEHFDAQPIHPAPRRRTVKRIAYTALGQFSVHNQPEKKTE